jgi:hypothetical protein
MDIAQHRQAMRENLEQCRQAVLRKSTTQRRRPMGGKLAHTRAR